MKKKFWFALPLLLIPALAIAEGEAPANGVGFAWKAHGGSKVSERRMEKRYYNAYAKATAPVVPYEDTWDHSGASFEIKETQAVFRRQNSPRLRGWLRNARGII